MSRFVLSPQVLINPTLAIKAASSAVVKTSNATRAIVGNKIITVAAQDMPALTGTIPTAYSSSYAFQVNAAGTVSVVKGNNVLTATGITGSDLPVTDKAQCLLGLVFIDNATGSTFTGGTTALDTASLTVAYTNNVPEGI